ncbi:MAG: methionine adenosyltransferase [Candidatus Andersenbacteria bacterium]|nr:methionine adenosyltransferase [Candidatus Andersenbacteria bacterium]
MHTFLFTSESVTAGHPDKVCDAISDAILDTCLAQDPLARVAVECAVKDQDVWLFGELTTAAAIDPEKISRSVIADIGYTDQQLGFSAETAHIHIYLSQQSSDIAQGVSQSNGEIGAGDQGMMFGYADRQTKELMPLPITLAHALTRALNRVRRTGRLPYLRPDGKSQVTVRYEDGQPRAVTAVVISAQHHPDVSMKELRRDIRQHVINAVIPPALQAADMVVHINPTGRFVIGGPVGDSGLTGRKIIVDTYGGWARHGGGCFSGKDPTKVDRSAAYAARQAAASVVSHNLADACEIQLAYAIGIAQPISIHVNTFGTERVPIAEIDRQLQAIDFRPAAIINRLQLQRPIYRATAAFGHFGRPEFPWEQPLTLATAAAPAAVAGTAWPRA